MPETAENVAEAYGISREDQDAYALRSQQRAAAAYESGVLRDEIVPILVSKGKGAQATVENDEHCRPQTTIEALAKLPTPFREGGTVTAGNASGMNDGACALVIASQTMMQRCRLTPRTRIVAATVSGIEPRVMGVGPVPAIRKLLQKTGLKLDQIDVIELNEAFAAQVLASLRELGVADDASHVNPNGGAIALGHPLGMSGARLVATATAQLCRTNGRFAICAMCIGVGQGIALLLERVSLKELATR